MAVIHSRWGPIGWCSGCLISMEGKGVNTDQLTTIQHSIHLFNSDLKIAAFQNRLNHLVWLTGHENSMGLISNCTRQKLHLLNTVVFFYFFRELLPPQLPSCAYTLYHLCVPFYLHSANSIELQSFHSSSIYHLVASATAHSVEFMRTRHNRSLASACTIIAAQLKYFVTDYLLLHLHIF
jgi:hypothetical protein